MATVKETRITEKVITVGVDEFDTSQVIITVSANTRQSDGTLVNAYQRDITDMVDAEVAAALAPLLLRAIQRIMNDRSITTTDLEEGHTWVKANRPDAPTLSAPHGFDGPPESAVPPEVEYDEIQRKHLEEVQASLRAAEEQSRAAEEESERQRRDRIAQLEEAEHARLMDQGARYEQDQVKRQREAARIERIREKDRRTKEQAEADEGRPAPQRRVRPLSRPTQ